MSFYDMNKKEVIEKVLNTLARKKVIFEDAPLRFWDEHQEFNKERGYFMRVRKERLISRHHDKTIAELIKSVFYMTKRYPSVEMHSTGVQCRAEAKRSAWDIYRHIKRVRDDVTIFDVMGALYKMSPKLRIQYCGVVQRRVFYPCSWYKSPSFLMSRMVTDEFGLIWDEWGYFA